MLFFVVLMIFVFCCCVVLCLLLLSLLLCFYVVMLLNRLEAETTEKGRGRKVEGLPVKSKGADMFPTLEIMLFLFVF